MTIAKMPAQMALVQMKRIVNINVVSINSLAIIWTAFQYRGNATVKTIAKTVLTKVNIVNTDHAVHGNSGATQRAVAYQLRGCATVKPIAPIVLTNTPI